MDSLLFLLVRSCVTKCFLGRCNTYVCLLTPNTNSTQTKVWIPLISALVNLWVYWGYLKNMGEGYLPEQKWLKDGCLTKIHPIVCDSSQKSGILEHTAQPAGGSTDCRVPFSDASVSLNLFQVALLLSASSRQLVWSQNLPLQLFSWVFLAAQFLVRGLSVFIAYSGRDRPTESGQFQKLFETILSCLLLV